MPSPSDVVLFDLFGTLVPGGSRSSVMQSPIVELAARLGAVPTAAAVDRAVELRLELNRSLFEATWALPVLDQLRAMNVLIGVVSDCSAETPDVWTTTALARRIDTAAFSCFLGVRKPSPMIYRAAMDALDAEPSQCIFVGDGGSNELSGAQALGIRAIWYDDARALLADRPDQEADWNGERITDLAEILAL